MLRAECAEQCFAAGGSQDDAATVRRRRRVPLLEETQSRGVYCIETV